MLADRRVIFKARVGSHLYGTSTPNSDEDFLGVFLPNENDIFGLDSPPSEITEDVKLSTGDKNQAGDIDCKFLSLKHFFKLLLQGQSIAVELLFVPREHVLSEDHEWLMIQDHKDILLSRRSIVPMIGFALSQVYRSEIKGFNLNLIRDLIQDLTPSAKGANKVSDAIEYYAEDYVLMKGGSKVKYTKAEDGTPVIEVANRMFNLGATTTNFVTALAKMEAKYGQRAESAAKAGLDTKSLSHAYRLVSQAEEFLQTGSITFPRPDAEFLRQIRAGEYIADYREDIGNRIDKLKGEISPASALPEQPDRVSANELYKEIIRGNVLD